ncbi:MAG: PQQ-dependent sugar dehydrogenase [Methylococcales bacterium]
MNSEESVRIFRSCLRTCLLTALGLFLLIGDNNFAQAENTTSGLDVRPSNSTCIASEPPPSENLISLKQVFTNLALDQPAAMVQPPQDSSIWVFAERPGKIRIFENNPNVGADTVALNVESKFATINRTISGPDTESQQWGITSIALDPDFNVNGYLYISYNTKINKNTPVVSFISRFALAQNKRTFDPATEKIIFSQEQETPWHHIGQIAFGNDRFLYIGLGSDRQEAAQDVNNLKGKILRIDVHNGDPYSIPLDNPFASGGGAPEIFALGMRNPWRFSFDRETGVLFVGDVGESTIEEIHIVESGKNYGWPILDGTQCLTEGCDKTNLTPPIHEYSHVIGTAVIGGFIYRGNALPNLNGSYIFGDAKGGLWKLTKNLNNKWIREDISNFKSSSFTQDVEGELYVFDVNRPGVFKIVPPENTNNPAVTNVLANRLSETGCVNPNNPTQPATGMIPYTVNTPLWSDGAEKDRWLGIPNSKTISVDESGDMYFPIGTVLMKNFAYEGKLFETRLFMRHQNGEWAGYSYEWTDDLSEAFLLTGKKSKQLTNGITWDYPSREECMACHTDAAGFTLGPEIVQLNGNYDYPSTNRTANQAVTWDKIGLFKKSIDNYLVSLTALHAPDDESASPNLRARSYLHVNCSGCHRPEGPAQGTSDFRYNIPISVMNICNQLPTTNVGNRILDPGNPDMSSISIRMHILGKHRMPPVGTVIVDETATTLIDNWIQNPGICLPEVDSDNDGISDTWELLFGFDAVNPSDALQDTDNDGVSNLDEYLAGTLPNNASNDKSCTLDVDGDANVDALTDGLLYMRHMFGIQGESLVKDAVGTNCAQCTAAEIEAFLNQCADTGASDMDGNGEIDALTDGLLSMRFMFGIRGPALINSSVGSGCTRCSAGEIEGYMQE